MSRTSSDPPGAVRATGLGKRYLLLRDQRRLLGLARHPFRAHEYLWALRGLELDLGPGASLGVIGPNGSGKSTLLRVLAGVTAPTEGELSVSGRVASLITIGAGFHPELTGRENIEVGGIVLGMPRRQIERSFDDIVAFSGLAPAIDRPVKHYSSGMFMRLGFSVAAFADPDVLLIDEVLAVGDIGFQARCLDRIEGMRAGGTTIIFVSHAMNLVQRICPRALVLSRGEDVFQGPTQDATSRYLALLDTPEVAGELEFEVDRSTHRVVGGASVRSFELTTDDGRAATSVAAGSHVSVRCRVGFDRTVRDPVVVLGLLAGERIVYELEADPVRGEHGSGDGVDVEAGMTLSLGSGVYRLVVSVRERAGDVLLMRARPASIQIRADRDRGRGVADLRADISAAAIAASRIPEAG